MTQHGYTEQYVKFFRQKNRLHHYDSFQEIAQQTYADPRIQKILAELQSWPCHELTNHKQMHHPLHMLSLIAELGLTIDDPQIASILERILSHQADEGPFQILLNIPTKFGGTGTPLCSWMLCDAPLVTYAAVMLNNGLITKAMERSISAIAKRVADNGWHCQAAVTLGKFRGPGRKADPCPYATLLSLKMLSVTPASEYLEAKQVGLRTLLDLWEKRQETKPYLFAMGTDFHKLKLPFVWYDILHVVDVLSRYPAIHTDIRFQHLFQHILEKRTEHGWIPESMYMNAKGWDFGQKKVPSEYMAAIIERIMSRIDAKQARDA